MATTTPNFGWTVPTSSDLVKNGATAIETLGDAIDASLVDLKGGTTGQVLSKATNTDMDFTWATATSGAVTLISSTSFTNQASQAFDGVFSSSYKVYLVYFKGIFGSANNNIRMQLRTAGPTTVTANYFNGSIAQQPSGTTYGISNNNAAYAEVSSNFGSSVNNSISGQFTFLGCTGVSEITSVCYQTVSSYSAISSNGGFFQSNAGTHTGFILTASAGNLTGTVQIFGVN